MRNSLFGLLLVAALLSGASTLFAQPINEFHFAPVGSSYSAALPADSPLVGRRIVSAKIFLYVRRTGGKIANFNTDILFPIDPWAGRQNSLTISGSDLTRTEPRTFEYVVETKMFNGHFIAARYGAETPGEGFDGRLLAGSRIVFVLAPPQCGSAQR